MLFEKKNRLSKGGKHAHVTSGLFPFFRKKIYREKLQAIISKDVIYSINNVKTYIEQKKN